MKRARLLSFQRENQLQSVQRFGGTAQYLEEVDDARWGCIADNIEEQTGPAEPACTWRTGVGPRADPLLGELIPDSGEFKL